MKIQKLPLARVRPGLTRVFIFLVVFIALLAVEVMPASAVVRLDPELEAQLRAQGALESVLRQMQRAADEGFFEMPVPPEGEAASKRATWNALVILVDFDDKPNLGSYPASDWQDHLFSQGTHPTGSMTDIYLDNSYGDFLVTGDVVGWYRMPNPYSYYVNADGITGTNDDYGFGSFPQNAAGVTVHAIEAADPTVNFNEYRNGRSTVDGLFIVHAGAGAEQTGSANDIWSHQSSVNKWTNDGVQVRTYTHEPEYRGGGFQTDVGVFAHEFGHVLGLPDLYDTDYSSNGVGRWSMMAGGSWNGGGARPADFDAWCKIQLGWLTPIEISGEMNDVILPPAETSDIVYKLHNETMGPQEYFLLENRQPIGNDLWLPGEGLLFWHVDDSVNNNRSEACSSGDAFHPILRLLQADGLCELENGQGSDAGDPFPGSTGNPRIDSITSPNTRSYLDLKTSIALFQIRLSGSDVEFDLSYSDVVLAYVPTIFPSLPQALSFAGPGDEVRVQGGLVSSGEHLVPGGVILTGGWNSDYTQQDPANPSIIQGGSGHAAMEVGSSGQWTEIENFVVSYGVGKTMYFPERGSFGGGAFVEAAKVRFTRVRFEDNHAGKVSDPVGRGGGLAVFNGEVELNECSFANNQAQEAASIYLYQSNAVITDTSFEGSSLYPQPLVDEKRGGAILALNGNLTLIDCEISGYSQAKKGGAIYLSGGDLSLQSCRAEANTALKDGGAIWMEGGELNLADSFFLSNTAVILGAAIYATPSLVRWDGGESSDNICDGVGGVAFFTTAIPGSRIEGVRFSGNSDAIGAAALYLSGESFQLRHNLFYENQSPSGNGAVLLGNVNGLAVHNIFVDNAPIAMGGTPGPSFVNDHNLYWQNGAGAPLSGMSPGTNSLEADPRFVDALAGDFHLMAGSPAIDAGDAGEAPDFDDSLPDLGLYGGILDDASRPAVPANPGVAPAPEGGSRVYWSTLNLGSAPASVDVHSRAVGDTGTGSLLGSTGGNELVDPAAPGTNEYRMQAVDAQGHAGGYSPWVSDQATDAGPLTRHFVVGQPYPNPFNPHTQLRFTLAHPGWVRAELFDVSGRQVRVLADREFSSGEHVLHWDGHDGQGSVAASGVYLLRVRSEEGEAGRRLLLLK